MGQNAVLFSLCMALVVSLSSGCVVGEFEEPGPTDLEVPKAIPLGVGFGGGGVIEGVSVATAAALFQDGNPERWGVELTGQEERADGSVVTLDANLVMLDEVDPGAMRIRIPAAYNDIPARRFDTPDKGGSAPGNAWAQNQVALRPAGLRSSHRLAPTRGSSVAQQGEC